MEFRLVQNQSEKCNYNPNFGLVVEIILNQIWSAITVFRTIWYQTQLRLIPNLSENCNCNPNLVQIIKIQKQVKINLHIED